MDTGLGFIQPLFFVGVIENREDPRAEGRVQVRAFGVHGSNQDVPTEDLPWATLIIGSHDVNFNIPPLNAWVFGFFIDGRDAQQPMILGLIPTQLTAIIDPVNTGWGAIPLDNYDRQAQGSRPRDLGLSPISKLASGEFLNETYNEALETNRVRDISIAGGKIKNHNSIGNGNAWENDLGENEGQTESRLNVTASTQAKINALDSDTDFQRELSILQQKHGVTREQVYGIIAGESSYNPSVINRFGYAGFFQFGSDALNDINQQNDTNYTPQSVARLTPAQQLQVYDKYLNRWNFKNTSGLGIMQAAPAFASRSGDTEVYPINSSAWRNNPGWRGADGRITVDSINAYYARKNPPSKNGSSQPSATQDETDVASSEPYAGYMDSTPAPEIETNSWEEPPSAYAAQYPYNRVIETASGHSVELDDTPGAERIMIWHQNGSYIQIAATSTTHKNVSDTYDIHERNHHVYIRGNNLVTIDGDCHVLVKGNKVEEIQGDYKQIVHGNIMIGSAGKIELNGADRTDIRSASIGIDANVENLNIRTAKNIVMQSNDSINMKSKNVRLGGDWTSITGKQGVYLQSNDGVHIKSQGNIFMSPNQNLYLNSGEGTISIQSKGNLRVNAGKAIVMKSESFMSLSSESTMIIDSKTTTNINSSGILSVKSSTMFLDSGGGSLHANAGSELRLTGDGNVHIRGPVVYVDDIIQLANNGAISAEVKQKIEAPEFKYDPANASEDAQNAEPPIESTTPEQDGVPEPPVRSIISPDQTSFA